MDQLWFISWTREGPASPRATWTKVEKPRWERQCVASQSAHRGHGERWRWQNMRPWWLVMEHELHSEGKRGLSWFNSDYTFCTHCITPEDTWCPFVPLFVMLTLITQLRWCPSSWRTFYKIIWCALFKTVNVKGKEKKDWETISD